MATAGKVILIIGILMLAIGVTLSITVGTIAVPILISSSVIVNSIGITIISRSNRRFRN